MKSHKVLQLYKVFHSPIEILSHDYGVAINREINDNRGMCYAPFCLASQTLRRFCGELKTGIHETMHTRMVFTQQSPAQEIIGQHCRIF